MVLKKTISINNPWPIAANAYTSKYLVNTPGKSLFLGLLLLLGLFPPLDTRAQKWEFRPLEYFNGDYAAFAKANFYASGSPGNISMGQWAEYMEKTTPPTYFTVYQSVSPSNKTRILEIMLFFHPLELIKQYVHEKQSFPMVALVFEDVIYPSNPQFDKLGAIGVNKLIPWEEYKKYESILKDIDIHNPWPMEGSIYAPQYLANTLE
jgi:hypothetical protein